MKDGDIYVPFDDVDTRVKSRRVLGIVGSVVIYSAGGDTNRHCKVRTFRNWMSKHDAVLNNKAEVEAL